MLKITPVVETCQRQARLFNICIIPEDAFSIIYTYIYYTYIYHTYIYHTYIHHTYIHHTSIWTQVSSTLSLFLCF